MPAQTMNSENQAASSRVTCLAPIMAKPMFCQLSGLRTDQLRGQIQRANVHTIKIGGQVFINTARYVFEGANAQGFALVQSPVMLREKFAEATGTTADWVLEQLNNETLPPENMGRLKAVNVAELFRICLQGTELAAVS